MNAWRNWAHNQTCRPIERVRPSEVTGVVDAVQRARQRGLTVVTVGSGHSFSPIAVTDGMMIDVSRLHGIVGLDQDRHRVRLRAGTTLRAANRLLADVGLAFPNLGDIDAQTVAGAISTGTHGTGATSTGLSAAVTAVQIVLADGRVLDCSPRQHPELFEAARLSVGTLGVITEIEFACVPAFAMVAEEGATPLAEVLEQLPAAIGRHDHLEFYWFPYTQVTHTKRNRHLAPDEPVTPRLHPVRRFVDDEMFANGVFGVGCALAARVPAVTPTFNRFCGHVIGGRTYAAPSPEVFVSARRVRFLETESAIPVEAFGDCFAEIRSWFERHDAPITVPLEFRFAAADDVWLSTAYQRPSAYIAAHLYPRADAPTYLRDMEDICRSYGGRPHWGKLNRLDVDDVRRLYPKAPDFLAVRDRVDPERRFSNAAARMLFGP